MPLTDEQKAEVRSKLIGFPTREFIRFSTRTWTVEMFEYGRTMVEQLTTQSCWTDAHYGISECMTVRMRLDEEEKRERRNDERHVAVVGRLDALEASVRTGTKTHWTITPTFWVAVIAAVAGVASIVVAFILAK
jgi:hypothetical protein